MTKKEKEAAAEEKKTTNDNTLKELKTPPKRSVLASFGSVPILGRIFNKFLNPLPIVSVLRLDGIIGSHGRFQSGLTIEGVEKQLEKAFSFGGRLKTVAIVVNSPGGSPVQSDLIFKRIRSLAEEKDVPVVTFAEDAAASGGYFIACAGDEIIASENSIVGSIGVISGGFGYVEAMKKLGLERRVYTQGENKNILDPFLPEKEADVKFLHELQKDVHDNFKNIVRSRREGKIKKTQEKRIFSGEFWVGSKAVELGIIDGIGDIHSLMRERFGKDVRFIPVTKPKSFLKKYFGGMSESIVGAAIDKIEARGLWNRLGL